MKVSFKIYGFIIGAILIMSAPLSAAEQVQAGASPDKPRHVRVEFASGGAEEGDIVAEKNGKVVLDIEGATMEFSRSEIKAMTPVEGENKSPEARRAESAERAKLYKASAPAPVKVPAVSAKTPASAAAILPAAKSSSSQISAGQSQNGDANQNLLSSLSSLPSGTTMPGGLSQEQIAQALQKAQSLKARAEKQQKAAEARIQEMESQ